MSNPTFETKRFIKKISIELLKNEIKVKKTSPFDSMEYEISYENIDTKKTIESKVNFALLTIASLFGITGLFYFLGSNTDVSTILFVTAAVILLIAFLTKLNVVTIKAYEGNIELYFNSKNRDQIISFADSIISSSNNYILEKYSKIDKDLPIENQLTNLDFLRNKNLITQEKFEELKDLLLGRENKKSIGYR